MRVRFVPEAYETWLEALGYIASDSPSAAERLRLRTERTLRRLAGFPESGRLVPELDDGETREVIVAPYRFFYQVREDEVVVVSVWHGAQDVSGEADAD